jgi:hypothetical protein
MLMADAVSRIFILLFWGYFFCYICREPAIHDKLDADDMTDNKTQK